MDFLEYHPTYQVLICTSCKYALVRNTVKSHLQRAHKGQLSSTDIKECLQIVSTMCLRAPELVRQTMIPPSTLAIPYLALFFDGIICRLCKSSTYVCRSERTMRAHLKESHTWTSNSKGGRPSKASQATNTGFSQVTTQPCCLPDLPSKQFFSVFCCPAYNKR
jgi:hypothetical protein